MFNLQKKQKNKKQTNKQICLHIFIHIAKGSIPKEIPNEYLFEQIDIQQ